MEWPKRARTADWENCVLTLDGDKQFDIPELTAEIMEQLAGYTLVCLLYTSRRSSPFPKNRDCPFSSM